jgi:hypothetical protein
MMGASARPWSEANKNGKRDADSDNDLPVSGGHGDAAAGAAGAGGGGGERGSPKVEQDPDTLRDLVPVRCLTGDRRAILGSKVTLRAWAEFGLILGLFYFADRSGSVPDSGKSYDRDVFFAIFLALAGRGPDAGGPFSAQTGTHSCDGSSNSGCVAVCGGECGGT